MVCAICFKLNRWPTRIAAPFHPGSLAWMSTSRLTFGGSARDIFCAGSVVTLPGEDGQQSGNIVLPPKLSPSAGQNFSVPALLAGWIFPVAIPQCLSSFSSFSSASRLAGFFCEGIIYRMRSRSGGRAVIAQPLVVTLPLLWILDNRVSVFDADGIIEPPQAWYCPKKFLNFRE